MSGLKCVALDIPDVLLITPRKFGDARGYFMETWSEAAFHAIGVTNTFVQDNQSLSAPRGTLRGLHFQLPPHPQAKLVRVISGSVFDVAVDLRRASPTYGKWCGATLTADGAEQLYIPRGFAHAFCTLEPNTVFVYKVDGIYAPDCDRGISWDDPDIGINWPVERSEVTLSGKDAQLGRLRDFSSPF